MEHKHTSPHTQRCTRLPTASHLVPPTLCLYWSLLFWHVCWWHIHSCHRRPTPDPSANAVPLIRKSAGFDSRHQEGDAALIEHSSKKQPSPASLASETGGPFKQQHEQELQFHRQELKQQQEQQQTNPAGSKVTSPSRHLLPSNPTLTPPHPSSAAAAFTQGSAPLADLYADFMDLWAAASDQGGKSRLHRSFSDVGTSKHTVSCPHPG